MHTRLKPLLLAMLLCLAPLSAAAADLWSEEYYRAIDYTDQLSDAERESLDEDCLAFLERTQADLAVAAAVPETYEGQTLADFAAEIYTDCGFGYGENHTGFMMVWDTQTDEVVLLPMGGAEAIVPQSYLDFVAGAVAKYRTEYGVWGPLYATVGFLNRYLDENSAGVSDAEGLEVTEDGVFVSGDSVNPRVGTDGDRPFWYPTDPSHFQKYHDPEAPRVVDRADIIDDEREPEMEARLAALREELGCDIVIFTDLSSFGLTRAVYAADFYDFNGYGIGDAYEGACLLVCMEPGNRGFWTCCTGPKTRCRYTEEVANQIDDILFDYMAAGTYTEGLTDWIECFRRICLTGSPYTPDWAMDYDASAPRAQNPDAPRVVDEARLLTDEERAALTAKADELRETYQVDVVISTARSSGGWTPQEYADAFYTANGYGLGDGFDGILLTVFHTPGRKGADPLVSLYGGMEQRLTEANRRRLQDRCDAPVDDEEYAAALSAWLEQTEHALRTGRAPRSALSWTGSAIFSTIIGLAAAGFLLGRAKKTMENPGIHERADRYLDPTRTSVTNVVDTYLRTTTDTQYSPIKKDDDTRGGSSYSGSGHSTYSSSYTGSSGTTHTGSGRSF